MIGSEVPSPADTAGRVAPSPDARDFLDSLGVGAGRRVLVHSSFGRLSRLGLRAEDCADALLEAVGTGTLAMPAMSWRAVNPQQPTFDERMTPSITGVLTEVFRTRCADHRSLHPTHSVAATGDAASALAASHHLDATPCGPRSPWGLLAELDVTVVMLGVGMDVCTLVHHLEETFAPETYLRDEEESYRCIDRQGRPWDVTTRRHRKLMRNFWRFEQMLRGRGLVRDGAWHGVPAFAFRAADLVALGSEHMRGSPIGTLAGPGDPAKLM